MEKLIKELLKEHSSINIKSVDGNEDVICIVTVDGRFNVPYNSINTDEKVRNFLYWKRFLIKWVTPTDSDREASCPNP
jgi:hypothetical protein